MCVMDYLVSSVNLSFRIHDSQISATNTRDIFGRNLWDIEQTSNPTASAFGFAPRNCILKSVVASACFRRLWRSRFFAAL
jgi:hypothetical protein